MKIDLEQIFLSFLGSVKKLEYYLKNNIDLVKYIYQTSPAPMAVIDLTLAFIPKSKRKEILKDFTIDRVLGLLKRQRPDIYKVLINYPNGRFWLSAQIFSFKKHFLK